MQVYTQEFFYINQNSDSIDQYLMAVSTPENSSHSVIERPESVSLVSPPTTIISDTIRKIEINQ